MDEPNVSPLAVTAAGAVTAGVAAGSAGVLLGSVYGPVLGIAVAMPLLVQFGHGFGTLDREAYFADRERADVVRDAALTVAGAGVVGAVVAALALRLSAPHAVQVGVATGGAFAGGGAAYLWIAGEYHGEVAIELG